MKSTRQLTDMKNPLRQIHNIHKCKEMKTVCIYLRNTNRISIRLNVNPYIQISNLLQLAQKYSQLPLQNILIYLQGRRYDQLDKNCEVMLTQNTIIHLKNSQKIHKDKIQVSLQIYNSKKIKLDKRKFEVFGNEKIQILIWEVSSFYMQLTKKTPSIIECGRKLSSNKTFYQQDIQDNSTLIIVLQEAIQKLTQKSKEQKILTQSINFNTTAINTNCGLTPNFKKKQKNSMMYRSNSRKIQAQLLWQSDSSSQVTNRQLMTSLWKKKQKQNFHDHLVLFNKKSSQKTDFEKNQLQNCSKFKWQFKTLEYKQDLKKLRPPEIMTNDCFEESQDLNSQQFQDQDDDQNYQSVFNQFQQDENVMMQI